MKQAPLWAATKPPLDDTNIWIVDASSLIEIKKNFELTTQQEAFKLLEDMVFKGQIAIPNQVIKEICQYKTPDTVSHWVQKIKPKLKYSSKVEPKFVKMIQEEYTNFSDPDKEIDDADPYVVALACQLRDQGKIPCVVTEDIVDRKTKAIFSVCTEEKINCIDIREFLSRLGVLTKPQEQS